MRSPVREGGVNLGALALGTYIFKGGVELNTFSDPVYGKGYKVFDPNGTQIAERSANGCWGTEALSSGALSAVNIVMTVNA